MKPYKTDCFYYTEVHDMGACISQCKKYRQLGKCPCDNCVDYISNKEVHLAIQDYVRNKKRLSGKAESECEDYIPYQHIQHIEAPFDIMRGTFDAEKGILTVEPPHKAESEENSL